MAFILTILISSCSESEDLSSLEDSSILDGLDDSVAGGTLSGSGEGEQNTAGLITAGEWNDLANWDFWNDLVRDEVFTSLTGWGISTSNRVSVRIVDGATPLVDVDVDIKREGTPSSESIWSARTDNSGRAELWLEPFTTTTQQSNLSDYVFYVNGIKAGPVKPYNQGVSVIQASASASTTSQLVDLSFIVDATSSMSDELEFIKDDLEDVIRRVESGNRALKIRTSTVFYRDQGDEYLFRKSDFEDNLDVTLEFISNQRAGGGGDFPEAVHVGMEQSISYQQWSENARARIAFLILDAPPHSDSAITTTVRNQIERAASLGIKIIPITASGIDKNTELLMRQMAILTNSTYVFITNDSGIGNDHLEASVGEYEVEFLNDLMVRLIKKYTD